MAELVLEHFAATEQAHIIQDIIPAIRRYEDLLKQSVIEETHKENPIYEEPITDESAKLRRTPSYLKSSASTLQKFTGNKATNELSLLAEKRVYFKKPKFTGDRSPVIILTLRSNLYTHSHLSSSLPAGASEAAFVYIHDVFNLLEDHEVHTHDVTIAPLTQCVLHKMLAHGGYESADSPISVYYLTAGKRYQNKLRLLHKCGSFDERSIKIPYAHFAKVYHDHALSLVHDEYMAKYLSQPESRGFDREHQVIKMAITLVSTQKDALLKTHNLSLTICPTSDLFYTQSGVYDMSSAVHCIMEFSPHRAYYSKIFEPSVLQACVIFLGNMLPVSRIIHHTSRYGPPLVIQCTFVR